MKGKVLIIGPIGSGKSTLTKRLLNDATLPTKTQALNYVDWVIDTPGEYVENPMFYRSLMATAFEAKVLLVVQDGTKTNSIFPPNFAGGFPLIPIGVITKIDHEDTNIIRAEQILQQVIPNGVFFKTSAVTNEGIEELRNKIINLLSLHF
ncbi:EutP/PduV family microcompartment system protein [Fredinandcohnia sp. SECRCQ15]|uniref:EutP/PduV family microcompartment system protein n=1 Tax=Fredinandcohnia quinoae TaxID=2918902 RepID=A0AAW5DTP5_9BACI|nr:EutP/PduV family microcompartment system protein [Fredinandcohnia sp. SECRCQ15]